MGENLLIEYLRVRMTESEKKRLKDEAVRRKKKTGFKVTESEIARKAINLYFTLSEDQRDKLETD